MHRYVPGQLVPASGQYAIVDPYGRYTGYEITAVKGEPFPPSQYSGTTYVLVDRTKHRS
jgi:hypothetical protein